MLKACLNILLVLLSVVGLGSTLGCSEKPTPRGVILISLDTLRADHLGLYGSRRPTSPFLDSLASRAVVFDNERIQVPGTLPSHMSIFTGLYPEEHDVFPPDGKLAASIRTLPEVFKDAGFRTAGFTDGGYVAGSFGFARGFDVYDDQPDHLPTDAENTFAKAIGFLDQIGPEERFFLFLHSYSIHDPYFPPLPYTAMFLDEAAQAKAAEIAEGRFSTYSYPTLRPPSKAVFREHRSVHLATMKAIRVILPEGAPMPTGPNLSAVNRGSLPRPAPEVVATYRSLYDASIRYVDDILRAFFGSLEERGLLDSTIVVITADHGEEFLEHGRLSHEQVYQSCLHTPLLFVQPGRQQEARVTDVVESIDIAPTLYELMGVKPAGGMTGSSLVHLLAHGSTSRNGEAYARAAISDSRALVRFEEADLLQVVTPQFKPSSRPEPRWFSIEGRIVAPARLLELRARSFHEPRTVEVIANGQLVSRHQLDTTWSPMRIELPQGMGPGTKLLLHSDGCLVPSELGINNDPRCLAFAVENVPRSAPELFNLSSDPSGVDDVASIYPDVTARLNEALESYQLEPAAESETSELAPDVEEQLRRLGYID